MPRGYVIPIDVFVREYVRAASENLTVKQLAERLDQKPESINKRANDLRKRGVNLPKLKLMPKERDTVEVANEALAQALKEFPWTSLN